MTPEQRFFAYARERHAIYIRRQSGIPKGKLTDDPILKEYRFCNVFRELDTTTIWFRENVRDRMRSKPEVLLATVVFRWFNRIKTGEAIFPAGFETDDESVWNYLLKNHTTINMRRAICEHCGEGPYVTGSYIIKTRDGMDKLSGVLWCIREFIRLRLRTVYGSGASEWRASACELLDWRDEQPISLQETWQWLRQYPYLGDFMAYEIVSDLQYTDLLSNAPDIMTWANPGPGAMRGLNRIHGRELNKKVSKDQACKEMQQLLRSSQESCMWPNMNKTAVMFDLPGGFLDWSEWDMRTVEHTLCEFDKYERVRLGEGAPRQKFR